MPRLIEMGTLLLRCKQRADKTGDDFIGGSDTAEWHRLISEVYGADVFQVVTDTGLRYFETTATLTTAGVAYVTEPLNIAKVVRLDYIESATQRTELIEVTSQEQAALTGLTGSAPVYFALVDDRIYLYPTPATGLTLEIVYVPQAPDLSGYASTACVDVVSADGEACVIWGVAALAKIKSSQDASIYLQKQEQHRDRLQGWAADRVITQARRRPAADEYSERRGYDEGDYR